MHKGRTLRYSVPGQGFHEAEPNRLLTKYLPYMQLIPKDDILKQQRVLVPLCGKSVDMIYFANQKISALGLEAIPRAVFEFSEEINSPKDNASRLHEKAEHNWNIKDAGIVSIVQGDALDFKIDENLSMQFGTGTLVCVQKPRCVRINVAWFYKRRWPSSLCSG